MATPKTTLPTPDETSTHIRTQTIDISRPNTNNPDYTFVEPLPELSFEDENFLRYRGCLKLPDRSTLDAVVEAYFLYVHPHLPLIDEGWFWEIYSEKVQTTHARIPIFLLQCMLLVGCGFVATSTIHDLGFESVRAARATYYVRAKTLHDFEAIPNNLTRARGCLLMTFHVLRNEPTVNNYWLSIAMHHAKVEGADCYERCTDLQRRNQLKRLWWCCIIRDRSLSLGLRRPASIVSNTFEHTWPPLTEEDLNAEVSRSHVHSSEAKKQLIRSVVSLCQFCAVLMDLLQLLYPLDKSHATCDRMDILKQVYAATDNLDRWHDTATARHNTSKPKTGPVVLFRSLLDVYYETAKVALCNHRITLTLDEAIEHNFERLQAKKELQTSFRGISLSLMAIIKAGMVDYSPIAMVVYIALPSICQKLGNAGNDSAISTPNAPSNIYQDFLRVHQLKYEGADTALGNMSKLVDDMTMDHARSPSNVSSELIYEHNLSNSGLDLVVSAPHKYMQMVSTLDYLLRHGRLPTKTDLDTYTEDPPSNEMPDVGNKGSRSQQYGPVDRAFSNDALSVMPESLSASDVAGPPTSNTMDFSFDDFMLDGPFAGIERLSDMLHNYYDWT